MSSVNIVIKRGLRNPDNPANLLHSMLALLIQLQRNLDLLLIKRLRPSSHTTPRPGGSQTRSGPLADEIALKLGQGPEYMKHQLPA